MMVAACNKPEYIYVTKELPVREKPTLPPVKGAELMCLSKDTYDRLSLRERMLIDYARDLRGVIEINNEVAKKHK